MKIYRIAYDRGTIGPAVSKVTGKNFQEFLDDAYGWRAKFMSAADEIEKLNPQEGTTDYERMIWAKNIANALNTCMSSSFGDKSRNLYKL